MQLLIVVLLLSTFVVYLVLSLLVLINIFILSLHSAYFLDALHAILARYHAMSLPYLHSSLVSLFFKLYATLIFDFLQFKPLLLLGQFGTIALSLRCRLFDSTPAMSGCRSRGV